VDLSFILFLLVNATLFTRPAELIPALLGQPIYEVLILGCLVMSLPAVVGQLSARSLAERPASACVVGVFASAVMSHLSHFAVHEAITSGIEFLKVLLYYLLLVGCLRSFDHVRAFLVWLYLLIVILTALSLCQYHGVVDIPALAAYSERQEGEVDDETGEDLVLVRLCGAGIYNNPNDLSRILVVGMILGPYLLGDRGLGPLRFLLAPFIPVFGYALNLTHSRGGMMALLGSLAALFAAIYGRRKTILLGIVALPILMVLFAGRQTKISASEGTGQQRIQLWEEGFARFVRTPVFGIGMDKLVDEIGLVAHNSFVHCYTELGFVGGTCFLGAFYLPARALHRLGERGYGALGPEERRLRPYLMAITVGTITGMLTSTRSYSLPTYMIVGLNASFIRVASQHIDSSAERVSPQLVKHLAIVSSIVLAALYAYVRVAVRHGPGTGH
jgi:hypothetical protein